MGNVSVTFYNSSINSSRVNVMSSQYRKHCRYKGGQLKTISILLNLSYNSNISKIKLLVQLIRKLKIAKVRKGQNSDNF